MEKVGMWLNRQRGRKFWFDNVQNNGIGKLNGDVLAIKGSYCFFDKARGVCTINYVTDGESWLNESKAQIQLEGFVKKVTGSKKCIVHCENKKKSIYGQPCNIQVFWLSKNEPSVELLLQIENRIYELRNTAPREDDDMSYYERVQYTDYEPDKSSIQSELMKKRWAKKHQEQQIEVEEII